MNIIKLILFLCIVITYAIFVTPFVLVQRIFKVNLKAADYLATWGSKLGLKVLGVKVDLDFKEIQKPHKKGYLVVSNHLSYIDILILLANLPCRFITSVEMNKSFGLGFITSLACCILVERRNKTRRPRELAEIAQALDDGLNLVLFAESTTGDGSHVMRFRRPLFQPAIELDSEVLCLCLNYETINGKPVVVENRDLLFWYGDMGIVGHVWELLKLKNIRARLSFVKTIPAGKFEQNQDLAQACHEIVSEEFRPIV